MSESFVVGVRLKRTIDVLNGKLAEIVETREGAENEPDTVIVKLLEDASPAYPKGTLIEMYPYEIDRTV